MIQWTRKISDNLNNISYQEATINNLEVAFQEYPDFSRHVWNIRFDKKDYMGKPKILDITKEALSRIRQLKDRKAIINYLKKFIPLYLQEKNYNFDVIPEEDIITSNDRHRLPPVNL